MSRIIIDQFNVCTSITCLSLLISVNTVGPVDTPNELFTILKDKSFHKICYI